MTEPLTVLDRFRHTNEGADSETDVYDEGQDYRAFGFSRKPISTDPMINFIDGKGVQEALAYGHLYRLRFEPSEGITIEFTEHIVTIKGRRLREGYRKLSMQRVVFICEADRPTAALVDLNEPLITELTVTHKRELLSHG